MTSLLDFARRVNLLAKLDWNARQRLVESILLPCPAALLIIAVVAGHSLPVTVLALVPALVCLLGSRFAPNGRVRSWLGAGGLVYSVVAAVALSGGSAETHLLFLIVIAFIAACAAVVLFANRALQERERSAGLTSALAGAEINRRKLASEVLATLDQRNQSLLYRQLDIINRLAERERDPDALAELFRLDHLATRIRRNSESLLVLSGQEPPSTWSEPVPLLDVVRDAIAETEDLERVAFYLDARLAVLGRAVPDVTHLLGELIENAVRFSPPQASVIVRLRPHQPVLGAHVLTIEDSGIGIRPDDLKAANEFLAEPREVDLAVTRRLGLHVVSRLAARHGIHVSLTRSPGSGVTASVVLPFRLFADPPREPAFPVTAARPAAARSTNRSATRPLDRPSAWPTAAAARPAVAGRAQPAMPALPAPRRSVGTFQTRGAHERGGELSFEVPMDFGLGDQEPWSGWWEPPADAGPESPSTPRASVEEEPRPPAERPERPERPERVERVERVEPPRPPVERRPGPAPLRPLARRVPQSHIAPELREGSEPPRGRAPEGAKARDALSRYQASRRAARALLEDDDSPAGADAAQPGAPGEPGEPSERAGTDQTDRPDGPDRGDEGP